ncbi:amidohydrolase family protein [Streptomyces sp. NPDC005917]|uniref:amidohydrolase family protein n=1 Tax=unclassified Streptomyces TaxID=2593676 RepID=UPI0033FB1F06
MTALPTPPRSPALIPVTGVDTHAHVLRGDAPLAADRHSRPAHDSPVGEYLALLDAHGLSHGVLTAPSFYGTDNGLLLDALAVAPDRLRGTASVPVDTGESELLTLRAKGIMGIRLNWSKRTSFPDPASTPYQRLFATARDCGMHVEVLIEDEHLSTLADAILRTGAELVIDHFGMVAGIQTPGANAVLRALETGLTWLKLSAPYRPPADQLTTWTRLLAATAPDRLVWGSDWPWVSHEHDIHSYGTCLDHFVDALPDRAVRHAVLVTNPALLLTLVPSGTAGHRSHVRF